MNTIHSRIRQARINAGLTQSQLAERLGVTPQSVQQWESTTAPRRNRLVALCTLLNVKPSWVLTGINQPEYKLLEAKVSNDEYAFIPQYSALGGCGDGVTNDHVEINGTISFKKKWLSSMGLKPQYLSVIYADGDSMYPTIASDAVVLVDHSQAKSFIEGKVYVIRRDGDSLIIKRLFNTQNGWIYRSDNPNKSMYPDLEPLCNDDIIGRVVWQGGCSGL